MIKLSAAERVNLASAKYSVHHNGKFLPVTNLFDSDGNEISNPMRADRCVCCDESSGWYVVRVKPGDIA